MTTEWVCLIGEKQNLRKCPVKLEVSDHPLKPITVTMLESRGTRKFGSNSSSIGSSTLSLDPLSGCLEGGVDPLSQFIRESDPLSQMAAEYESSNKQKLVESPLGDSVEQPWSARRSAVLNKFTTSEKLTIVTSFLTGGEMIKTQTTVSEKVKHRLEQLDDFDEGSIRQMMDLTQQEYVIKIEQLNQELIQAWHSDQRVKSLKIAIQCSKFLADTSVMQFYPSKFVLVTDILDIFGKLVFERLKTKADHLENGNQQGGVVLPDNFTPEMVSDSTKETCLNWFYKVASIRELLPRLYVEMAILKCYSFLTTNEFNNALLRLTKMIRGIGDPLIAMYARCYLCRIGMTVTSNREYIKENLNDFLETYQTMFSAGVKTEMFRQRMDISSYLSIYSPALDWIMEGIAARAPDSLLNEILNKCQAKQNNGLLLTSIISTFNPQFISNHANELVLIISASATEGITKSQLFRSLGSSLSILPPPPAERLNILNKVWSTVRTFTHPSEYIVCVENWAEYTTKHVEINDLNSFLGEIVQHMTPKRAFENHYAELQSIVEKVVRNASDLEGLLVLDNFLPLMDLFQKESIRLDVCKYILTIYKNNSSDGCLRDPIVTNALMFICKNLNDAVNALTVEDERRQICYLISHFIKQVDFGRDFEQQLTFYVDARAAFPNLDLTFATLVQCVVKLAMDTRRIVKGQHSRKIEAFVKACAAYCFITIPSIVSVMTRLDLYLLAGQIALVNLCLGQADSCFEAALNLVPELPKYMEIDGKQKNTETYLISYICNFLSTLIIVPDSPDQGVLYLIRLLIDSIKQYPFDSHGNGISTIYLHILDMLSVSSQEIYPYHIPNVVSNDELYGSDPKFLTEINLICSEIVDQILINLKFLGDGNQLRIQSTVSLELFTRIVVQCDVRNDKMFGLAVNLWNLAIKNRNSLEPRLLQKTLQIVVYYSKKSPSLGHSKRLDDLLQKIKTKL